jgi:hypothetical protein
MKTFRKLIGRPDSSSETGTKENRRDDNDTAISGSTALPSYEAAQQPFVQREGQYPVRGNISDLRAIGFKIERAGDNQPDKITLLPKYEEGRPITISEDELQNCEKTGISKCYTFNRDYLDAPNRGLKFYFSNKYILAKEEIEKKLEGIEEKFPNSSLILGKLNDITKKMTVPVKSVFPAPRKKVLGLFQSKQPYDVVDDFRAMIDTVSEKAQTVTDPNNERQKTSFQSFLKKKESEFFKRERYELYKKETALKRFIAQEGKTSGKAIPKLPEIPGLPGEKDIELHQIYDSLLDDTVRLTTNPKTVTKKAPSPQEFDAFLARIDKSFDKSDETRGPALNGGGKPSKNNKRKTRKMRK